MPKRLTPEEHELLSKMDKAQMVEFTLYQLVRAHIDRKEASIPEEQFRDAWQEGMRLFSAFKIMGVCDIIKKDYKGQLAREMPLEQLLEVLYIATLEEAARRLPFFTNMVEGIIPNTIKNQDAESFKSYTTKKERAK